MTKVGVNEKYPYQEQISARIISGVIPNAIWICRKYGDVTSEFLDEQHFSGILTDVLIPPTLGFGRAITTSLPS